MQKRGRGRPALDDPRTVRVEVYLTGAEWLALDELARALGHGVAAQRVARVMRTIALDTLQRRERAK